MSIVTIISDLGNDSYSLAALKGKLYQNNSGIKQIIDISNEIRSFDIVEAAFVFSNAYKYFPKNSIHILSVNPFYGSRFQLILLEKNEQFFIAPNNGILPLIFENTVGKTIHLLQTCTNTEEYYALLADTVRKIISKEHFLESTQPEPELFVKISLQPVVSKNIIRGTIIHVDRFGNLISNIRKEKFDKIRGNRDFAVYFRHKDPITRIRKHYHEVPVGDELCTFNMTGHLEIALNMGNASETLGLYLDDTIQIDFFEQNPVNDH